MTRALISAAQRAHSLPPGASAPKWELFRDLCAARRAFGLSDRDLAVLDALLTFHRADTLSAAGDLIVFPSNSALSERAHGMAESTRRRHLAALVDAGVRHDSPNGKRYAARNRDGDIVRAFGFDLSPLLHRASEITCAAREARAAADTLRRRREGVVPRLRDCAKLIAYASAEGLLNERSQAADRLRDLQRTLRRKLNSATLTRLEADSASLLSTVELSLRAPGTGNTDGSDVEIERHIQSSKEDTCDSEEIVRTFRDEEVASKPNAPAAIPLPIIASACPDLATFHGNDIRTWSDLLSAAARAAPILGINLDTLQEARSAMGHVNMAITVACILQRAAAIRSPGGYLRALARKAERGLFSPRPMVFALLAPSEPEVCS